MLKANKKTNKKPKKKQKKLPKTPENKPKMRKDYETNNEIIKNAIIQLINKKITPSTTALTKETGLNYTTIQSHYKDIKFVPTQSIFRTLTPNVIMSIYVHSQNKGGYSDRKLWMQMFEGWVEKQPQEVTDTKIEIVFANPGDDQPTDFK